MFTSSENLRVTNAVSVTLRLYFDQLPDVAKTGCGGVLLSIVVRKS